MKRIGIFAGTFDPVHKGHIAFALQARKTANLDKVYFLPEIQPRRKTGVTHIAHRIAMLKRALRPHTGLSVLDLPDKEFSVAKTWPRIQKEFPSDELFLLMGADRELAHLSSWPLVKRLLETVGLIVAQRQMSREQAEALVKQLPHAPKGLYVLESSLPAVSSAAIRKAVKADVQPEGALKSTLAYADKNWLYVAVSSKASS